MTLLIGQAFEKLFGPDVPIRFSAYDGSTADPVEEYIQKNAVPR